MLIKNRDQNYFLLRILPPTGQMVSFEDNSSAEVNFRKNNFFYHLKLKLSTRSNGSDGGESWRFFNFGLINCRDSRFLGMF